MHSATSTNTAFFCHRASPYVFIWIVVFSAAQQSSDSFKTAQHQSRKFIQRNRSAMKPPSHTHVHTHTFTSSCVVSWPSFVSLDLVAPHSCNSDSHPVYPTCVFRTLEVFFPPSYFWLVVRRNKASASDQRRLELKREEEEIRASPSCHCQTSLRL